MLSRSKPFDGLRYNGRMPSRQGSAQIHGTTVLCVRKDNKVVLIADGQVTMGDHVMSRRVFRALCFITWSPMVTCPSAISTTLLSLRTHSTVVPCICALPWPVCIPPLYSRARSGQRTRASGCCKERRAFLRRAAISCPRTSNESRERWELLAGRGAFRGRLLQFPQMF